MGKGEDERVATQLTIWADFNASFKLLEQLSQTATFKSILPYYSYKSVCECGFQYAPSIKCSCFIVQVSTCHRCGVNDCFHAAGWCRLVGKLVVVISSYFSVNDPYRKYWVGVTL
uniref:Uncharacterized protein n=1 Tax=Cacopsylla melanoneura TaxID=428564 RepID=A0A8D8YFS3_9HEMI